MKKRQKIAFLGLLTCLVIINTATVLAAERKPGEEKSYGVQDIESGFSNFSDNVTNLNTSRKSTNSNVVGTVFDNETGVIIENASILVDGQEIATTDYKGRFQIIGLENGEYTWTIKKDGFEIATYDNYPVASQFGASVFTFYISQEEAIYQDFFAGINEEHEVLEPVLLDEEKDELATPANATLDTNEIEPYANLELTDFQVIYPNGETLTPTSDFYISHVVSKELYAPNSSHYPSSMTSSDYLELFKAQAVVARTYANYIATHYNRHDGLGILCSGTHCQAFDPTYTNEMAINATLDTTRGDQEYVVTYNGSLIEATFFAHCNGQTKDAEDLWGSNVPYLQSVSCPYDISNSSSYFGHGIGFCQDGAAGYADRGTSFRNIITHYYKGTTVSLADSAIVTGWVQEYDGSWYYYDSDGRMQTGWVSDSGSRYYLDATGVMQTDWVEVDGEWYFFRGDGSMKAGEWQDWPRGTDNWYWLQSDGTMAHDCTLFINGKYYDFDSSGLCLTNDGYVR